MALDVKTQLANLLLTERLPDSDVAADLLLAAELHEPVRMLTPPDPAKCRSLIRGSFVKAATFANSTDDPPTLAKLAKHGSIVVKRAVAANPHTPDAARLDLERYAIGRNDSSLVEAVLRGASVSYLIEGFQDSTRRVELIYRFLNVPNLRGSYPDLIMDQDQLETMLLVDPKRFAPALGAYLGAMWPHSIDPLAAGSVAGSTVDAAEVSFLANFASNSPVIDTTVLAALDRIRSISPESWPTDADAVSLPFRATRIEDDAVDGLCAMNVYGGKVAFRLRPDVQTASQLVQRYGWDRMEWLYRTVQDLRDTNTEALLAWMLREHVVVAEDGSFVISDNQQIIETLLRAADPADDVLIGELLARCGSGSQIPGRYLTGSLGPVNTAVAGKYAVDHWFDVLLVVRQVRERPWGAAIIRDIVGNLPLEGLLDNRRAHHTLGSLQADEQLAVLERIAVEYPTGNRPDGTPVHLPVFNTRSFIEHIDTPDADSVLYLTWLRTTGSSETTVRFFDGQMQRKPQPGEIDALIDQPGSAFGTSIRESLPGTFEALLRCLTVEQIDRVVDAAGSEGIRYLCIRSVAGKFAAYLSGRLLRETGSGDEWRVAFELLTKSNVPIGTALTGARRLTKLRDGR